MDLITRYLHAVKGHLPADQQDAAAELEDDLRSRIEEREAALGRPVTEAEVAAVLKGLGRPMVFAARYQKHQALIGAAMLPYYLQTLKVGGAIALLVNVVVAAVLLAAGKPVGESLKGVFAFPFTTLPILVGWITVVFVVIERAVSANEITDSWDPATLPAVPREATGHSRVGIVGDIVGIGIALAWWLVVIRVPFLVLGPISAFLVPGPAWERAYLPVAVLMLVAIGGHTLAFMRPQWRRPTRIAGHLLALAGLAILWFGGDLLAPTGLTPPPDLERGIAIVHRSTDALLALIAAITCIELGRDLWKLRRARQAAQLLASLVILTLGAGACVPRAHPLAPRIAALDYGRAAGESADSVERVHPLVTGISVNSSLT